MNNGNTVEISGKFLFGLIRATYCCIAMELGNSGHHCVIPVVEAQKRKKQRRMIISLVRKGLSCSAVSIGRYLCVFVIWETWTEKSCGLLHVPTMAVYMGIAYCSMVYNSYRDCVEKLGNTQINHFDAEGRRKGNFGKIRNSRKIWRRGGLTKTLWGSFRRGWNQKTMICNNS